MVMAIEAFNAELVDMYVPTQLSQASAPVRASNTGTIVF